MHELIIIYDGTGQVVHREAMEPQARYQWYTACADHEVVTFGGVPYRAILGAWLIPEQEFVMRVTNAPQSTQEIIYYDDD